VPRSDAFPTGSVCRSDLLRVSRARIRNSGWSEEALVQVFEKPSAWTVGGRERVLFRGVTEKGHRGAGAGKAHVQCRCCSPPSSDRRRAWPADRDPSVSNGPGQPAPLVCVLDPHRLHQPNMESPRDLRCLRRCRRNRRHSPVQSAGESSDVGLLAASSGGGVQFSPLLVSSFGSNATLSGTRSTRRARSKGLGSQQPSGFCRPGTGLIPGPPRRAPVPLFARPVDTGTRALVVRNAQLSRQNGRVRSGAGGRRFFSAVEALPVRLFRLPRDSAARIVRRGHRYDRRAPGVRCRW
jgi:hypothetical protein